MASPHPSDWWERHPLIKFAFLLAWGGGLVVWCVAVVRQGSFQWGRGHTTETITRVRNPIFFWYWIWQGLLLAGVVAIFNVRSFVRRRHLPKSKAQAPIVRPTPVNHV